ncbi:hypothetical protein ANN_18597 [Periplaneta americana]|uniref:Reverse transcriptase domain-containing protein n=1 Tax=Periplaneta americana TaxID=6978 RepID=A0ABQ8SP79_PERAM|nr:hypothetical protein ANN_18597 [Periplaneta americana]
MWAKLHQHWTVNDWKNVLFSDESHFEVHGHRVSYVRKGSEKVTAAHLQQAPKYPPKVMFWGCFTHEGPGALIPIKGMMNSDKYIHLLETRIVPQLQKSFLDGRGMFQQDLAPCHMSRKTTEFFKKKNIQGGKQLTETATATSCFFVFCALVICPFLTTERYLEKNKEVYIVFVVLEKTFDRVDWNKLMDILKKISVNWKERRVFSNLNMQQRVKVRIGEEMSEESEMGRGVRQGCPLSSTLFNIYLEDLVKNCFQNMGGLKVGGRRIKCIRFADDMALLAEEEMILRDMLLELNDSCEQYGMKINANKTKTMVIGKKIKKVNLGILNEAVEQVDSFKYLGCTKSSNMSCSQEVKRRIAMAKEAFNRKRTIFCEPLENKTKEETSEVLCVECGIARAETWTLRRSEEKRIQAFEM